MTETSPGGNRAKLDEELDLIRRELRAALDVEPVRHIAEDIGVSIGNVRKLAEGRVPRQTTLVKLRAWCASRTGRELAAPPPPVTSECERVAWRIERAGALAKVLKARNVIHGLRKLNRHFDALYRLMPERADMLAGLHVALRDQLVGEFAFRLVPSFFLGRPGIKRGMLPNFPKWKHGRVGGGPRWVGRLNR
jgi:hypothetical protein